MNYCQLQVVIEAIQDIYHYERYERKEFIY